MSGQHYPGELRAFFERVRAAVDGEHLNDDCEMVAQLVEADRRALEPLRNPNPKNEGMRISLSGVVASVRRARGVRRDLVFCLDQLEGHLHEMKRRVDAGDYAAVHELLDLYCIDGTVTR